MEHRICMSKPFIIKKTNRRYCPAFIIKVLKEAKHGKEDEIVFVRRGRDKKTIEKYGLNKRVFYKWKKRQSRNEYYTR